MPFDDLDEQLKALGFGQQWAQQSQQLAKLYSQGKVGGNNIARLVQYNKQNPEKHRQQKRQWQRRRYEKNKHRIGKQRCYVCSATMDAADVIGDQQYPGHCKKCRKEIKNGNR